LLRVVPGMGSNLPVLDLRVAAQLAGLNLAGLNLND
jgi:hypothetical protein